MLLTKEIKRSEPEVYDVDLEGNTEYRIVKVVKNGNHYIIKAVFSDDPTFSTGGAVRYEPAYCNNREAALAFASGYSGQNMRDS